MLDEQIYSQVELKEKVRTLLSEEKISVLRFIEQGKDVHWLMMWLKERVDEKLQYIDIHLERYKEEEIKKEEIRNFIEYIILEQQRNKRKMTYTVAGLVLFVLIIGSIITAMFESDESARIKPNEEETTLANSLNRELQEDSKSSIVKTDDNQKEESKDKKEPVKKEEPKDKKEPVKKEESKDKKESVKKEEPKDKKEPVKKEESKDKKEPVKKEETAKDKKEPVKKEETAKDESNSSNKIEDTTAKAEETKKESNSDKEKDKEKDKDKDKASDDEKGWWQKFIDFIKSLFGMDDSDETKDSAAKAEDKKAEKQKEKEKALEEKRAEKEKALEEKRAEKEKALEEKKAKEKALEEKKAEKAKEKEEDKETEEKGFWASIADFFKTLFGMNDEPKEKEKE
ncbi:hypothetical protein [Kurthia gibsonii]|uniref:hypothetical protein n=1 Tax=Kurthia gibsonii TaxID=33946 RepID=UPI002DB9E627|nr:hypothetical protein [Kurthia gibsonii]MEB7773231.1 hypothetical protein [Kurthia gibsonii]